MIYHFDISTRKFDHYNAKRQGLDISPRYISYIEHWAYCPSSNGSLHRKNIDIQHIFQDYAAPEDILPYSIDEGFIDLTSSLNYFVSDKQMDRKAKIRRSLCQTTT